MTLGTLHPETEPAGGTRRGGREVRSVSPWDLTRVTAAPASGLLMFCHDIPGLGMSFVLTKPLTQEAW